MLPTQSSIHPSIFVHASLEWNRKWMNGLFIIVVTTALVWLAVYACCIYYDHPFCSSFAWFDSYMFLRMKHEDFYVNFNDWISFCKSCLVLTLWRFDILFSYMPLCVAEAQNNFVFIHHVLYKINYYGMFFFFVKIARKCWWWLFVWV